MTSRRTLAALALPVVALAACQSPAATSTQTVTITETAAAPSSSAPATSSTPSSSKPASPTSSTQPTSGTDLQQLCLTGPGMCLNYAPNQELKERVAGPTSVKGFDIFREGVKILSVTGSDQPIGAGCTLKTDEVSSQIISSDPVELPGLVDQGDGTEARVVQAVLSDDGKGYIPVTFLAQDQRVAKPGGITYCDLMDASQGVHPDGAWRFSMNNFNVEADRMTKDEALAALKERPHQAAKEIIETVHRL